MACYALAQINVTVGDLEGNARRVLACLERAAAFKPDLVVFPELTLAGYPPEDLLLNPGFIDACDRVLAELAPRVTLPTLLGLPRRDARGRLHNSAVLLQGGQLTGIYHKQCLPNYAVFDEERYYEPGSELLLFSTGDLRAGVVICEDAWAPDGPVGATVGAGAGVVACLSASPFHRDKAHLREEVFAPLCRAHGTWFLYCNLVGGQDELVFDGGSLIMDPAGRVRCRARRFQEDLLVAHLAGNECHCLHGGAGEEPDSEAQTYGALVLGLRDYVRKNGFRGVVVGLSGGIDSALTAAVAVDALGPENVLGVTMPGRYTSGATRADVEVLARNLDIRLLSLAIEAPHQAFADELGSVLAAFQGDPDNLTDQNLQARIRAVYLMAISNKSGLLVINTSNKSEAAVGYGTLYGDMVGGFAAIKDVFKTQVWALARHCNRLHGRELIPVSTIERVPTAELRPGQEDRQSIPDYPVLDPILELYVEQDRTYDEIVRAGHDPGTVQRVINLVDRSEFKRRQSVMGVRVTPKAFGKDRRLPVTNRFRQW